MSSSSHSPACLLQCIALQVQCACSANAMHMQRNASGCNAMQKKRSWRKGGDGIHIVVGCTGIVSLLRSQWRGEGREGGRHAQCILIISPLLSQCIPSVLHFSFSPHPKWGSCFLCTPPRRNPHPLSSSAFAHSLTHSSSSPLTHTHTHSHSHSRSLTHSHSLTLSHHQPHQHHR